MPTLSPSTARQRFAGARVVRLATNNADGTPHLVPVTVAMVGPQRDRIGFVIDHKPKSTKALRRLANIAADPRVTFLADCYDEDWTRLWWARADAVATVVQDWRETEACIDALAGKYRQYRARRPDGPVVVATVQRWSGWEASA